MNKNTQCLAYLMPELLAVHPPILFALNTIPSKQTLTTYCLLSTVLSVGDMIADRAETTPYLSSSLKKSIRRVQSTSSEKICIQTRNLSKILLSWRWLTLKSPTQRSYKDSQPRPPHWSTQISHGDRNTHSSFPLTISMSIFPSTVYTLQHILVYYFPHKSFALIKLVSHGP